jgi:hypothetical protein
MGDADPEVARENAPNSFRALYGVSRQQNAVMGSIDVQIAELQIASLFASSPPFPAAELSDAGAQDTYDSTQLHTRRKTSDDGYARSNASSSISKTKGKVLFRARPLPKTHDVPDIQPRTTRAANLRAGIVIEKTPTTPRAPLSKARLAITFANVPGHKRSETIPVASTAPPVVAPRMTRAASLRLGQPASAPPKRRPSSAVIGTAKARDPVIFEGVPGHKRRDTISVASVKAPTVAPRLNKSAALRASKDTVPPTSYMCKLLVTHIPFHFLMHTTTVRAGSAPKPPGLPRSGSQASLNGHQSAAPHPPSQSAIDRPRPASTSGTPHRSNLYKKSPTERASQTPTPTNGQAHEADSPPVKQRPRPASVMAPTIAPRTNKSALLRAAKMEAAASPAKSSKPKPATRAVVH